jgi:response regulator of citrate/malate metabolism
LDILNILLVEDEPTVCHAFEQYAAEMEFLSIIASTDNATKALADIQDFQPDAVILDLELHKGGGTGIDVLTGLTKLHLHHKPFILITTNNSSQTILEYTRTIGADFILSKHQSNYSEQIALSFLDTIRDVILTSHSDSDSISQTCLMQDLEQRLRNRLHTELDQIGISPKHLGYNYLIDTILLKVTTPSANTTDSLAKKYHKSGVSIERAIQNAINYAWTHETIENLLQYYTAKIRSDKGVPTMTEFVNYYVNKLNQEYL